VGRLRVGAAALPPRGPLPARPGPPAAPGRRLSANAPAGPQAQL